MKWRNPDEHLRCDERQHPQHTDGDAQGVDDDRASRAPPSPPQLSLCMNTIGVCKISPGGQSRCAAIILVLVRHEMNKAHMSYEPSSLLKGGPGIIMSLPGLSDASSQINLNNSQDGAPRYHIMGEDS